MPTARRLMSQEKFCKPETVHGWWTFPGIRCIAAYQAKGVTSLVSSYVNLANPGEYDLTSPAPPSFDITTGWDFDGVTQHLNMKLNTNNFIAKSTGRKVSMFARFSEPITPRKFNWYYIIGEASQIYGLSIEFGWWDGTNYRRRYSSSGRVEQIISVDAISSPVVMGFAGEKCYYNGVLDKVFPIGKRSFPASSGGMTIGGARWLRGGSEQVIFTKCYIQAAAFYCDTLSDANVATLTGRMDAL